MQWSLVDAEQRHLKTNGVFGLPSMLVLEQLAPGSIVKLGFEAKGRVERMWVNLTEVRDDFYIGLLDSNPFVPELSSVLSWGESIAFKRCHVFEIYTAAKAVA